MHTPLIIQTAFTAAALIAGSQAAPLRRASIVDELVSPSSPSSRRGSVIADDLPGSRRGSIVEDIVASRRRSSVEEPPIQSGRRRSIASPEDVANARKRSPDVEALAGGRRSSLAASPADIANARRRSLLEEPVGRESDRRSSPASPGDIANARRRSVIEEPAQLFLRRSSSASHADIANARRRSVIEDPSHLKARSSSLASPKDIARARRRSVADETTTEAPEPRRSSMAGPADIMNARKRSVIDDSTLIVERRGGAGYGDIAAARKRSAIEVEDYSFPPKATPLQEYSFPPKPRTFPVASTVDIAAARRRATVEGLGIPPARRSPMAVSPHDIINARRRSLLPDTIPVRRSSLSVEALPSPDLEERAGGPSNPDHDPEEPQELNTEEEISATTASVPLFKRENNPLTQGGVVDWDAADSHLAHINIKYEKGVRAYQTQTGSALLGSKFYTPIELEAREAELTQRAEELERRLARRASDTESETTASLTEGSSGDSSEDEDEDEVLPTIEEAFMVGATEFAVANPKTAAYAAKAMKKKSGGVKLTPFNNDLLWAGPVAIGTPAQHFVLDFDTGSADTWVPSSTCTTSACLKHNRYDPSASSSSSLYTASKLNVQYGDGSTTSGLVYTDSVTVAGMTAQNQAIGVATTLSNSFKSDPMDGIMGMGYESISQMKTTPFFQTLMRQGKLPKAQFSFSLNSAGSGSSELFLGGANPAKYSGSLEWHPVASQSYWVLTGNAHVNNDATTADFYGIIDTGTTVVVAPPEQAQSFWANVEGSAPYGGGYYTFPCDSVPDVSFSFGGGKRWEMSKDNINLGSTSAGSGRCVGSIVGMDVGISAWIIGDAFLKDVYTSFDFDTNSVGFAEKKSG